MKVSDTELQVLKMLGDENLSGRTLRERLRESRLIGRAKFYAMMAQMEDKGLVHGWYETVFVSGQSLKQRWYGATAVGDAVVQLRGNG